MLTARFRRKISACCPCAFRAGGPCAGSLAHGTDHVQAMYGYRQQRKLRQEPDLVCEQPWPLWRNNQAGRGNASTQRARFCDYHGALQHRLPCEWHDHLDRAGELGKGLLELPVDADPDAYAIANADIQRCSSPIADDCRQPGTNRWQPHTQRDPGIQQRRSTEERQSSR